MEIICKNCGNKQEYKLRNKKIPIRPKTQCKNCQKWIYIDSSLLTKNVDQNDDQIIDQINKKIVPGHIIIAWNDLAPSIGSAFSKRKWPTKHKMFAIFDNWMKSLLEA